MADTNPTARSRIAERLWLTMPDVDSVEAGARIEALLDDHRAEVLAEAADRMADLLKETPEYGPWVAEQIRQMAVEGGESRG